MIRRPPNPTLFPSTPLFRSQWGCEPGCPCRPQSYHPPSRLSRRPITLAPTRRQREGAMTYEPPPDRRTQGDRRQLDDRRSGVDRRAPTDRRTADTPVPTERRGGRERRGGGERRVALRRSLAPRRLVPDRRAKGVAPRVT